MMAKKTVLKRDVFISSYNKNIFSDVFGFYESQIFLKHATSERWGVSF